jgi:mRNA interferase MazF
MIRRGDIYFVDLNPTRGREQKGRRPVLVVSVDAINTQPLVVTVVVGTDAANVPRDYPVNARFPASETGLPTDTVFLCFQVRSLDPSRFRTPTGDLRPAGQLSSEQMQPVNDALRRVLGL